MPHMIKHYEIIRELGSGATGKVYQAKDTQKNQLVAMKILNEEMTQNENTVQRFHRQIRHTIQLDHPNIIVTYNAGEINGRLFYVMEYMEGITVQRLLLKKGAMDEATSLQIIMQIAYGLQYASGFDVVHRDIKPDNIIVNQDVQAKLCDMGLAKCITSEANLTVIGTVIGTPHYMSPEQARGDTDIDSRSDIFSLGATWYHMVTGCVPFNGKNALAIMKAVLEEELPPARDLNPQISRETCEVIITMLVKDRDQRYQNFDELLQDLDKLHKKQPTSVHATLPEKSTTKKFHSSFVPSEMDILVGQIALKNGLLAKEDMKKCLQRQEQLALTGIVLDLGYVLLERRKITPQQKATLDNALMQYILDRGDEMFLRQSKQHNLLDAKVMEFCQNLQNKKARGIGARLIENDLLDEETREKLVADMTHNLSGIRQKALLKLACEAKLLSQAQAEKCSRIYSNGVAMGHYQNVEQILREEKYLEEDEIAALQRALACNALLEEPAVEYLKLKKISRGTCLSKNV